MKPWLYDLREAGVDLEMYGKLEASALGRAEKDDSYIGRDIGRGRGCGRSFSITLTYGRHPEDWAFDSNPCVETFAGEFWATQGGDKKFHLERMPGSWHHEENQEIAPITHN
ncbi:hypothetical protein B0J13DRAFT_554833 [Dactylonectria estremocensis]|uniref:Uncharacterized protein n=1 Tax=Dactylonectria estremocensis TaxID=1079267 RepID=A0A9P9J523_9HYPO|nr:hypothetical protein B0J13DRAFT_554833 [Dactylonectria estremocensis]